MAKPKHLSYEKGKWHDGEPFTSEDVQFTIMDVLIHPRGLTRLKKYRPPDDHTAIFNLDNPTPYMMRAFAGYERQLFQSII